MCINKTIKGMYDIDIFFSWEGVYGEYHRK